MLLLPFVFLCNTILFAVVLEERFKLLTSLSINAGAYLLSLLGSYIVFGYNHDPLVSGPIACAVHAGILVVASVFSSSNNLCSKIILALSVYFNYVFCYLFVTNIFGIIPMSMAGISSILISNAVYLLLTLLTAAMFSGPYHYFYKRGVDLSSIILCVIMFFACITVGGFLSDLLGINSDSLNMFSGLILYVFVIFNIRTNYFTAKKKVREIEHDAERMYSRLQADNFNSVHANVNNYKEVKASLDKSMNRIAILANQNKVPELQNYIRLNRNSVFYSALLEEYCENPYVNSIVATKKMYAKENGIDMECNINLQSCKLKLIDLCCIINQLLSIAVSETEDSNTENKKVHFSVQPAGRTTVFETVFYSEIEDEKKKGFSKELLQKTAKEILQDVIMDKQPVDSTNFNYLVDLVERLGGKMGTSASNDKINIKISILN